MPFIYLVQREDFADHAEEDEGRIQVLSCYTTARDANRATRSEAKSIYEDADPSLAEAPEENKDSELYHAVIYLREDYPGADYVVISVEKMFLNDSYESDGDEEDEDEDGGEDEEDGEEEGAEPVATSGKRSTLR